MRAAETVLASKMLSIFGSCKGGEMGPMARPIELDVNQSDWVNLLGTLWCRHFHDSVMWPIRGEYECRSCGRRFVVPWDRRNKIQEQPVLELAA